MHFLNRLLKPFRIGVHRLAEEPHEFLRNYRERLNQVRQARLPFDVIESFHCDTGDHPYTYKEFECGFAASCVTAHSPRIVLDIGSYRDFVLGLSAVCKVTALDVRPLPKVSENETVVAGDARRLTFPDGTFDAVISLSSVEHFGLGRYGDEFDLEGDGRAVREMKRCLKPGGFLIFTTTITRGRPVLAFNGCRIYSLEMLRAMCSPFSALQEAFFSHRLGRFCDYNELSSERGVWEVYCGCWRKE